MQLFADFPGDLNKNKKPLKMIWTIYVLKKLNTEIFLIKGGSGTKFPGFLSLENWGGGGGGGESKTKK